MQQLTLGAILYPGFELLDMFGPLEMFTALPPEKLRVVMIAQEKGPVTAGSMSNAPMPAVMADYDFDDAPPLDLLLLPGGVGTFTELSNPIMLAFLKTRAAVAQITASVCTGSALLAAAGLLDGRRATSNKQVFDMARVVSDQVDWIEAARWVDDGAVVTSSGVSAGMDMSLAIIARLFDQDTAEKIAAGAEYSWHQQADSDPFIAHLNQMMP